jgi:hypothetical protein
MYVVNSYQTTARVLTKYSMLRLFIFILLIGLYRPLAAQNCSCEKEFLFLKRHIENNYAGFNDKTGGIRKKAYLLFTEEIAKKIKKTVKPNYCTGLQKEWLSFFKDGHIQIGESHVPAITDTVLLNKLAVETEKITITKNEMRRLSNSKKLEGIYYSADSFYKIALRKEKNIYRDYAGIILTSKSALWKPGQVKLELKEIKENVFIAYTYNRDHVPHVTEYTFNQGFFNDGIWKKAGSAPVYKFPPKNNPVLAEKIAQDIFYIQIQSFDPWNAAAIDSVFKTSQNMLESTPNLILDLRGNGGGADFAYSPIIPYLYTNPVYNTGVDVIASDDNIKGWLELLKDAELPTSTKDAVKNMVQKMEKHRGQLVSIIDDDTAILEKIIPNPRHIVILIDDKCASSTEQFLLAAAQSRKVTLMGQRTRGVLDYANMRDVAYPCSPFTLSYATTRSRRLNTGKGVDAVGIRPNVFLPANEDWIIRAIQYLTIKE